MLAKYHKIFFNKSPISAEPIQLNVIHYLLILPLTVYVYNIFFTFQKYEYYFTMSTGDLFLKYEFVFVFSYFGMRKLYLYIFLIN